MRHFKFHWEFIYGKIFSNEYFPVISRIEPLVMLENVGKEWKINVKKKLKRSYNNSSKDNEERPRRSVTS
jgi:hypothetical protein